MPLKTDSIIDYLKQIVYKLDKIQKEVEEIKTTVEANSSNAFESELANEKLKKISKEKRMQDYDKWFEENSDKVSSTSKTGGEK